MVRGSSLMSFRQSSLGVPFLFRRPTDASVALQLNGMTEVSRELTK